MVAECNKYVFIFSNKRVNFLNFKYSALVHLNKFTLTTGDQESALSSFQTLRIKNFTKQDTDKVLNFEQ